MRVRSGRSWIAAVAVVGLAAVGLQVGPVGASTEPGASGASFYTYDGATPLAKLAPGTVLKTRSMPYSLAGIPLPLNVTQVLYRTTDQRGRATANVTSVIKSPVGKSTDRVIAYESFYDSLSVDDSPSRAIAGGRTLGGAVAHAETLLIVPFLLQGYSVVVADTEGPAADFAAGPEYGMTTLDSLRAVSATSTTGVAKNARVGLIGYSGGAIGTNWTSALAPTYAPDVNRRIVGAAEGGLLVEPAHNLHYIDGSLVWAGVAVMALVGVSRAFGIDLTPYLNDYGLSVYKKIEHASIANVLGAYPGLTYAKIAKPQYPTPESIPVYVQTVNKLNLGQAATPTVPMFIGQGSNGVLEGTAGLGKGDGVMVAGDVRSLARQYCSAGATIKYQQYPLTSHVTTVPLWLPTAISWLTARFGTAPAPSNCGHIAAGNSLAPLPTP